MAKVSTAAPSLVHGTAFALAGRAVLIRGKPGSGKSDLALRCLMQTPTSLVPHQATLVADDQVFLSVRAGRIVAQCPDPIRGLLEVRGLGILTVPFQPEAELALVADLVCPAEVERLPEPESAAELLGVLLKRIAIAPFEASAPAKLLLALSRCGNKGAGAS